MRNLLIISVLLVCAYLYLHPQTKQVVEPPPRIVAAPPTAPANSRLYYHSPLDASAMPTNVSTAGGYYSSDANARFDNYQHHAPASNGTATGNRVTTTGARY